MSSNKKQKKTKLALALSWDLSSTLGDGGHPIFVFMVCVHACVHACAYVCVTAAQQLGMAPRSLTRHAVPLTNSRRATATCVSRPCESPPTPPQHPHPSSTPPPPASHPTPAPTQSSAVYLMNSTLGAAGFFLSLSLFARTAWRREGGREGRGGERPPVTSEGHPRQ